MTVSRTQCSPHSTPTQIFLLQRCVWIKLFIYHSFHISVLYPRIHFTPLTPVAMATIVWHWGRCFSLTAPPVPAGQRKRATQATVGTVRAPLRRRTRRRRSWPAPGKPHHQLFHPRPWIHSGCYCVRWTALTLRSLAEISGHARRHTRWSLPMITCLRWSRKLLFPSTDLPLLCDVFRPQAGYLSS